MESPEYKTQIYRAEAHGDIDWSLLDLLFERCAYPHFLQSAALASLLLRGGDYELAVTRMGGDYVAASLLRVQPMRPTQLVRLFVDRGPIYVDMPHLEAHLAGVVKHYRTRLLWLDVHPYAAESDSGALADQLLRLGFRCKGPPHRDYVATVSIDVSQPVAELLGAFQQRVRRGIKKADKLGVTVRNVSTPQTYLDFVDLADEFSARRGIGQFPSIFRDGFYGEMLKNHPGNGASFAIWQGEPIAGILNLVAGDRMFYVNGFSSDDPAHRKLPQAHLLHWVAMQRAKACGLRYYDFGGYWLDRGQQDPINQFKTGFGGEVETLIGEFRLVTKPMLYRGYRWLRRLVRRR